MDFELEDVDFAGVMLRLVDRVDDDPLLDAELCEGSGFEFLFPI